jgi:hypothetical protein
MTKIDQERKTCGWPSRSDWPVYHYDGRWYCSLDPGHKEDHRAHLYNDLTNGEVVWKGPWVPESELTEDDREEMGME